MQAAREAVDEDGNAVALHDNPQATVHLVIGTAGASFTKNSVTPPPSWNEVCFYEYGYSVITAVNSTYLSWRWLKNIDDSVLDHMVITQVDPTIPWKLL